MGDMQEIETLINEEALLLAMFLRQERQSWKPRIAELPRTRIEKGLISCPDIYPTGVNVSSSRGKVSS